MDKMDLSEQNEPQKKKTVNGCDDIDSSNHIGEVCSSSKLPLENNSNLLQTKDEGDNQCELKTNISSMGDERCDMGDKILKSNISQKDGATSVETEKITTEAIISEFQNDSALCLSPKSIASLMDTSCDKICEVDQEVDIETSTPYNYKKNDSGICLEKHNSEEDLSKTFEKDFLEATSKNSISNNTNIISDIAIPTTSDKAYSKTDEIVKESVPFSLTLQNHSASSSGDGPQNCDKSITEEVKSIDLDSDDFSEDDDIAKDKEEKGKEKNKKCDSDTASDSSGPNTTFDVNTSKDTADKKSVKTGDSSSSNNSDIEQEMDALDLFISHRKKIRRSSHSSQDNNDNDDQGNDNNEQANERSDDLNETKSDDSEHSESDTELVEFTPPRDPWSPLLEVRSRELGFGSRVYAPERFRTRCGGSVRLAQRLKRNCKLENHDGCVNALHFNRSGTLLASGSDDLNIVVWNWLQVKPYFVFDSGHRSNVFQCKFMPYTGDSHIVSCARDGQIRLAELSTTGICKGTKKLAQHKGAAHKLALLEDSSHLFYSCGEDAVVYLVDLREEKPNKLCTTKENDKKIPLYSIHSNPMKSYEYCVGGRDHFLRVYDKRMLGSDEGSDSVLKKYCPHHLVDSEIKANVTCAVFSWDGQEVLGTYNDEDIYLFDNTHSDGAEFIHRYKGHRNNATVKGINFYGPKSEFIVSGSDCGNVFLWEKNSEKIVNYFHADEGGVVNVLEPHPHMPVLATSGLDHDVKIWMPMGGEVTKMDGLAKRIKKNTKERESERINEPEMLDGRMLWFLMHHLRRARRRPSGDGDSSTDSDDVERGQSDQSDDDDDDEEPMQCAPS